MCVEGKLKTRFLWKAWTLLSAELCVSTGRIIKMQICMTLHFTQRPLAASKKCNIQTDKIKWAETLKLTLEAVVVSNVKHNRGEMQIDFEPIGF